MSKVRLYRVNRKNGHGETWSEIVPAHSGEAAASYFDNTNVASRSHYLGFYEIELYYNGISITFRIDGTDFNSESPCYDFLYNYMANDINRFISLLRSEGLYP